LAGLGITTAAALHMVERHNTAMSADMLEYEVTIEDPKVFTRPWKMRDAAVSATGEDATLHEYYCVEFDEEVMYGHLRQKTSSK
jgi:hypothetical protein